MPLQMSIIQFSAYAAGTVAMVGAGVTDRNQAIGLIIGYIAGMVISRLQLK